MYHNLIREPSVWKLIRMCAYCDAIGTSAEIRDVRVYTSARVHV